MPDVWRSDALLPRARCAIVIASGGRALWDAFARSPEFGAVADPLDAYTRRVVEAAAAALDPESTAAFAFGRRAGAYADFVELGRRAGLGAPSRLRLLLHPLYGPWMSLRAVVLTRGEWGDRLGGPLAFDPCGDCPAPCESVVGPDFTARRRACVVGPEHVYCDAALDHHRRHAIVA